MTDHRDPIVLALNAGSSSLKFELFEPGPSWRSRVRGAVRDIGRAGASAILDVRRDGVRETRNVAPKTHAEAAAHVLDAIGDITNRVAVSGHRIVHGGDVFTAPEAITPAMLERLGTLASLAPLHNPAALAVLDVVRSALRDVPAVAVFDTAFFAGLPEHAKSYAVPRAWRDELGIKRFGFHGIAHAYLSSRLAELHAGAVPKRVVTLHLGQGCSAAAIDAGRPVETSMGFTPLEGLVMGTRVGDIDPGALLHVARSGRSWKAIDDALNTRSGLLGLSGTSGDARELLAHEDAGDVGAALALAVFCHRVRKYVGAYAAVLGGLDALVFGGGIGENSPRIRARICADFGWLGLALDATANTQCAGAERQISTDSSAVAVHVIPVHEEEAIARSALACLGPSYAPTTR